MELPSASRQIYCTTFIYKKAPPYNFNLLQLEIIFQINLSQSKMYLAIYGLEMFFISLFCLYFKHAINIAVLYF